VLVAARSLLGVAAQAIGQALASRTGTEAESLGEAIVEADGHVHGHAYSVARCQHPEVE
jgi:hypothetical protein